MLDEEMEKAVFDWIGVMRASNLRVSRRMIKAKAKDTSTEEGFKASNGWLQRFMMRNGLSLRRKTTVCQRPPADSIPKLVSFITHLRQLQKKHKYQPADTFAMDETACWMDMPSDTTIDVTGARSIPIKTTGHEKDHFTVILTARADGTKLKPYVVFKGKGTRLMKKLQNVPGVIVRFSKNGWMNDELTIDYLHSVIGQLAFRQRLLVWDAYRCHTSEAVRAECSRLHLHTSIVPGGCTKFIQGPDVVWNACFKAHMHSSYDTWLSEPSLHEFTKGGNMKPPQRSLLCDWVRNSWECISREMIKESFMSCAITTSPSGSDDDKIHCFKPGQPCEAGRSALATAMETLNSPSDSEGADPFASDEDEDEAFSNELFVEEDGNESDNQSEEEGDESQDSGSDA